jgi:hypothetical protein
MIVISDKEFISGIRVFIEEVLQTYPRELIMKDWEDLKIRIISIIYKLIISIGSRNKDHQLRIVSLENKLNNIN